MVAKKPLFIIYLDKPLHRGSQCLVDIQYRGKMYNDTSEGLFRNSYTNPKNGEKRWFVATNLRPNLARRVFPSFDEPAYKVPFRVSVVRHPELTAMANMPLSRTEQQ